MTTQVKLGLNIYFGSKEWVGGPNYIKNIILALRSLPPLKRPAIKLLFAPRYVDDVAYYQAVLPFVESVEVFDPSTDPDVDVLFPTNAFMPGRNISAVGWIPDLQHKCLPQFFSNREIAARDKDFAYKCAESDLLVISSRAVLKDLATFFHVRCPTFVLPFCSSPEDGWFDGNPESIKEKYDIRGEYIICCNQFWAHKDHGTLFKAVAHFKRLKKTLQLVCTGTIEDYRNQRYFLDMQELLASLGIEDHVKILGLIDRFDQIQLMRGALAVVQPSLFEGWSTVIEDARLLGKTVIYSDIPVHVEQNPPHGVAFAAGDARSLVRALQKAEPDMYGVSMAAREKEAAEAHQEARLRFGLNIVKMLNAAQTESVERRKKKASPAAMQNMSWCKDITPANVLLSTSNQWTDAVVGGASSLKRVLFSSSVYAGVLSVLGRIVKDDYTLYVEHFIKKGLSTWGESWYYADICTVLYALAKILQVESYLEIGVRQGRSLAMVAAQRPNVRVLACDMWMEGYAGMPNPGPEFVKKQLRGVAYTGEITFLTGNSHDLLPEYFARNPDCSFDLITVDGDHSKAGAAEDLMTVLPRLRIGGALIFDDIAHPAHPELPAVWREVVGTQKNMSCLEFTELGYGVAVAVRIS
jgi:predicted O-methyltransferase YrrM